MLQTQRIGQNVRIVDEKSFKKCVMENFLSETPDLMHMKESASMMFSKQLNFDYYEEFLDIRETDRWNF
jgi:hypothetical protein